MSTVIRIITALVVATVVFEEAPASGQTPYPTVAHYGRIASWGPVLYENGQLGYTGRGEPVWAEYQSDGEFVRTIPNNGEVVYSGSEYDAMVDKWNDAEAAYPTATRTVNAATLVTPRCVNSGGQVINKSLTFNVLVVSALVPDSAFDVTATANELPPCLEVPLITSSLSVPNVDSGGANSVLVGARSPNQGQIVATAQGDNYFGYELGVFVPNPAGGGTCQLDDNRSAFSRCDPRYHSEDGMLRVWSPIEHVQLEAWGVSGSGVARGATDVNGFYFIPLSFTDHQLLSVMSDIGSRGIAAAPISGFPLIAKTFWDISRSNFVFDQNYDLWAKIRYSAFNARRRKAGYYYQKVGPLAIYGNQTNFTNFFVETVTARIIVGVAKTPESGSYLPPGVIVGRGGVNATSTTAQAALVPVVGVADIDPQEPDAPLQTLSAYTEYEAVAQSRGAPTRDPSGRYANQGLLKQISALDLAVTDTYIYRYADGEMIGSLQGVSRLDVTAVSDGRAATGGPNAGTYRAPPNCDGKACLEYSLLVRGASDVRRFLDGRALQPGVWSFDDTTGELSRDGRGNIVEVIPAGQAPQAALLAGSGLRMGDVVQIVVINRVTGYMGTARGQVVSDGLGAPYIAQISRSGSRLPGDQVEVILRPPNLRVQVRRLVDQNTTDPNPLDREDGRNRYVSHEGAALKQDSMIQFTTQWYDERGEPLPYDLPGFTGRLSRSASGGLQTGSAGGALSDHFAIRPGQHTSVLMVPRSESGQHLYLHVSGHSENERITFNSSITGDDTQNDALSNFKPDEVCYERYDYNAAGPVWQCFNKPDTARQGLDERPASFVPFMVAKFDKEITRARAVSRAEELRQAWLTGSSVDVLDRLDRYYWWVYSPEMQFSLYDLDVNDVKLDTRVGSTGRAETAAVVDYDLSSGMTSPLDRIGESSAGADGLTWSAGYERIDADTGSNLQASTVDPLEWQLSNLVGARGTEGGIDSMTAEDFLTMSLYVDGDENNPLWELESLVLLLGEIRPLRFERSYLPTLVDDAIVNPTPYTDSHKLLRFVITKDARIDVRMLANANQPFDQGVPIGSLGGNLLRARGEHFLAVDAGDFIDAGLTISPLTGSAEAILAIRAINADPFQTGSRASNPLVNHEQTLYYPVTVTEFRPGPRSPTEELRARTAGAASGSPSRTNSSWREESVGLADGALYLSRTDLVVPSVGPELTFLRSYSNVSSAGDDSVLGPGWRSNLDYRLIPLNLETSLSQSTPDWFGNLQSLRNGILERQDLRDEMVGIRWGDVLVNGRRFIRTNGNWRPERGFKGRLEERNGEFVFTDIDGTEYHYPTPLIPMPRNPPTVTQTPTPAGESSPGATLHIGTSLVYRIQVEPYYLRLEDAAGTTSPNNRRPIAVRGPDLGWPEPAKVSRIVAPNGQELTFDYHPADTEPPPGGAPGAVREITDGFNRRMRFTYVACTAPPCETTTRADYRLTTVAFQARYTSSFTTDYEMSYEYDSEGYLSGAWLGSNVTSDTRAETYYYEPETSGSSQKNLKQTQLWPDSSPSRTAARVMDPQNAWSTTYTYYTDSEVGAGLGLEPDASEHFPYEVVKTIRYPDERPDEDVGGGPILERHFRFHFSDYDGDGVDDQIRYIEDPNGHTKTYVLNQYGNTKRIVEPLATGTKVTELHWTIDDGASTRDNYIKRSIEQVDGSTRREMMYDRQILPDGTVTQVTIHGPMPEGTTNPPSTDTEVIDLHPDLGVPVAHLHRDGSTESWGYDPQGRMTSHTDRRGYTTTYSYYPSGLRRDETIELPTLGVLNGGTKTRKSWTYDDFGYPRETTFTVRAVSAGGSFIERTQVETTVFDARGYLVQKTDGRTPAHTTDYEYDVQGNLTRVEFPDLSGCPSGARLSSAVTSYCSTSSRPASEATFDRLGNVMSQTDATDLRYDFQYTRRSLLKSITRTVDSQVQAQVRRYDNNGNLRFESDWSGREFEHRYDPMNRRTRTDNRLNDSMAFEYDDAGRVTRVTDYANTERTMEYDLRDRVTNLEVGDGCTLATRAGRCVSTVYDDAARTRAVTEHLGGSPSTSAVTTYHYDEMANLTQVVDAENRRQDWTYAPDGSLSSETDEDGRTTIYETDYHGLPIRSTLSAGGRPDRVVELAYDQAGNLTTTRGPRRDAGGDLFEVHFDYDAWNRVTTVRSTPADEPLVGQVRTDRVYDFAGDLLWARYPNGGEVEEFRDELGRLVRRVDPLLNESLFAYDANGNLTRSAVPGSTALVTCYAYDDENRLTEEHSGVGGGCPVDLAQLATAPTCVPGANLADPTGATCRLPEYQSASVDVYDGMGNPTQLTDAYERQWNLGYDWNYNLTSRALIGLPTQAGESDTVRMTYRNDGLLSSITDRRGYTIDYQRDRIGRITRTDFPDNTHSLTDYHDGEAVPQISHVNRAGNTSSVEFDEYGNASRFFVGGTQAQGGTLVRYLEYDPAGQVTLIQDGESNVSNLTYNARGTLRHITHPGSGTIQTQFRYDASGNITEVTDELLQVTTLAYDLLDRQTLERFAGEQYDYRYDARGNVIEEIMPESQPGERFVDRTTTSRYDAFDRLIELDEDGLVSTYRYDTDGNLTEMSGPQHQQQIMRYDPFGRLTSHDRRFSRSPDQYLTAQFTAHDANGNPTSMIDPNGTSFTMAYDEMDRRTLMTVGAVQAQGPPGRPRVASLSLAFNGLDQITRAAVERNWTPTDPQPTYREDVTQYLYDNRNRLYRTVQTHAWQDNGNDQSRALEVDYAYDDNDNVTCISSAAGRCADTSSERTTRYSYDERQRLETIQVQGDVSTVSYLDDGRIKSMAHPNGTRVDYTYHDEDSTTGESHKRLFRVRHSASSGRIADARYRYYANGNQREVVRWIQGTGSSTTAYDYDAIGRLVDETETTGLGATQRTYDYGTGYNREGQQVFANSALIESLSYVYDDADRLLSFTEAQSGQETTFTYDDNGNQTSREVTNQAGSRVLYHYNVLDQLIQVEQPSLASPVLGQYGYDADGLRIREWSPGGARHRFYAGRRVHEETPLSGGGPTRLYRWAGSLHSLDVGPERGYYHNDLLGSVMAVTDASSGVAGTWRTDTWGRLQPTTGNSASLGSQRHVFTGHVSDESTGLVYMRGRYYDPDAGRFLSQDLAAGALSDPRSVHRYQYAHGDPVGNIDPSGLSTVFIGQHGNSGSAGVGISSLPPPFNYRGSGFDVGYAAFANYIDRLNHERKQVEAAMDAGVAAVKAIMDVALSLGLMAASFLSAPVAILTGMYDTAMAAHDIYSNWSKMSWKEMGLHAAGLALDLLPGVGRAFRAFKKLANIPWKRLRGLPGLGSLGKLVPKWGRSPGASPGKFRKRFGVPSTKKPGAMGRRGGDRFRSGSPGGNRPRHAGRNQSPPRTKGGAPDAPDARDAKGPPKGNKSDSNMPDRPKDGGNCTTGCCTIGCFTGATMVLTATAAIAMADISVGMRVATAATNAAQSITHERVLSATEVDSSWRRITLVLEDADQKPGERLEIELLRPPGWFVEHGVDEVGDPVYFRTTEPPIQGYAKVTELREPPRIEDGPGRVVLMILRHTSDELYAIKLKGLSSVLEATGSHPIYSLDRDDWVPVRDLRPGERLQASKHGPTSVCSDEENAGRSNCKFAVDAKTWADAKQTARPVGGLEKTWSAVRDLRGGEQLQTAEGAVTVEALERVRGRHQVYNLQVEGDHEFLVGEGAVRAHNCGPTKGWKSSQQKPKGASSKGKGKNYTSKNSRILRRSLGMKPGTGDHAHHIVPSTHPRAQNARDILDHYQIDVNGAANGVRMSDALHRGRRLHSYDGIDHVTDAVTAAVKRAGGLSKDPKKWEKGRKEVLKALKKLEKQLNDPKFTFKKK